MPGTNAVFLNENTTAVIRHVNATGAVEADLKLSTRPGTHNVKVEPADIPVTRRFTIEGLANGVPWYIMSEISPTAFPHPYLPADDDPIHIFTIIYTLLDEYGNGLQAKEITIDTSMGEHFTIGTNASGRQSITYGPSSVIGLIDITAVAVENSSVNLTDTVEFVNTSASNMIFTASPQSMPSADAKPGTQATLNGLVVDVEGNAVPGEWVKFTIVPNRTDYDGNYTALIDPNLEKRYCLQRNRGLGPDRCERVGNRIPESVHLQHE